MKFVGLADNFIGKKMYTPIFILPGNENVKSDFLREEYCWAISADVVESTDDTTNELFSGTHLFVIILGQSFIKNKTQVERAHLLERLTLCFFSKNYLTDNNCPVILVAERDATAVIEFKQKLDTYLNEQGMGTTVMWHVSEKPIQEQMNTLDSHLLFGNNDDVVNDQLMEDFFYNPENIGSYILFGTDSLQQSISAEQEFNKATQNFLSKNELYRQLVGKYIEVISAQVELRKKVTVVTQRLENAHSFVELAKNKYKDDYDLLFNYYHREYEVLPLWYKRVGHIIKVLMGKRSFRSLFNDDVKKYRD